MAQQVPAGLRTDDLSDDQSKVISEDILRRSNLGLDAISDNTKVALGLALFRIIKCTHGVPVSVSYSPLTNCQGCRIVGANGGHVVIGSALTGSSSAGQVKLTCYFADTSATQVSVAIELLKNGAISAAPARLGAWIEIGSIGAPAFSGTWVNFDSGTNSTAAFIRDALNYVHLKGNVKSGTVNTAIYTLPIGYRPLQNKRFYTTADAGLPPAPSTIFINASTGVVSQALTAAAVAEVRLDGITFLAEQ